LLADTLTSISQMLSAIHPRAFQRAISCFES
jgi:hypothetical protein